MTPDPNYSYDMDEWVVRFDDLKGREIPVMFIDSVQPGHHRYNFALVGDTAAENPDFKPFITQPHKFQLGIFMCPPGNGPAYHTHDYVETFLVLSGRMRFYYGWDGDRPDEPDGEIIANPWDLVSIPPKIWRGIQSVGEEDAWCFAVQETHEVFTSKDPYWPEHVVQGAREQGVEVDEEGKMIKPANFSELEARMRQRVEDLRRP